MTATLWLRSRELKFERLDDTLLAVDADSGFCYSLNETGGRVWEMIQTPATLDAICERMCGEYKIDAETCRREVSALLAALQNAGLATQVAHG